MKIWDANQKEIQKSLKDLLRFKVDNNYQIMVIHPYFDNVEYLKKNPKLLKPKLQQQKVISMQINVI